MKKMVGLLLVAAMGFGGLQGASGLTGTGLDKARSKFDGMNLVGKDLTERFSAHVESIADFLKLDTRYQTDANFSGNYYAFQNKLQESFAATLAEIEGMDDSSRDSLVGSTMEEVKNKSDLQKVITYRAFLQANPVASESYNASLSKLTQDDGKEENQAYLARINQLFFPTMGQRMAGAIGARKWYIAGAAALAGAAAYFMYRMLGRKLSPEKAAAERARVEAEVKEEMPDASKQERAAEVRDRLMDMYGEQNMAVLFPEDAPEAMEAPEAQEDAGALEMHEEMLED